MTVSQAILAVELWRTREFDTLQIAEAIGVTEADVCRLLDAVREAERFPDVVGTA